MNNQPQAYLSTEKQLLIKVLENPTVQNNE